MNAFDKIHRHQQQLKDSIVKGFTEEDQIQAEAESLEKAENDEIEKGGKRAFVGEVRTFGGREYIKTTKGWAFHGKGGGKKAQEHKKAAAEHHEGKKEEGDEESKYKNSDDVLAAYNRKEITKTEARMHMQRLNLKRSDLRESQSKKEESKSEDKKTEGVGVKPEPPRTKNREEDLNPRQANSEDELERMKRKKDKHLRDYYG